MSDIKDYFTSRWEGGSLVQFDYSQLEVIALAFLSGDEQLKQDIKDGVDIHCRMTSFLTGIDYTEIVVRYASGDKAITAARRAAKSMGFLLQYGGSANLMAKQTGKPLRECKDFIKRYYTTYHGVAAWQDRIKAEVVASRKPSTKFINGVQAGIGVHKSLTGRRYIFHEYESPEWLKRSGVHTSFSPTELKNYPVQGFATGDIVLHMLGILNRHVKEMWTGVSVVNTIHDSVIFDVPYKEPKLAVFITDIQEIMQRAEYFLKKDFDIDFDLPLKVDVEAGPSWGAMTGYKTS